MFSLMAGLHLVKSLFPAGGGAFHLPQLSLGVFLIDQPTHRLAVGSDRREHLPLKKFEGWMLPAGSEGVCEYDEPLEVIIIRFDEELLEEVGLRAGDSIAPQTGHLDPLTLQMALGAEAFLSGTALYKETMSRAFATHLIQSTTQTTNAPVTIDDRRLRRVIDHVHDNLSNDLSLRELAALAAMSPFHFCRAFRAATGSSPLQYVIGCRIDSAKMLLKTTKLTITEIAYRTGYDDPGRFRQHFKKRVGIQPSTFRSA
ncbi:MAG: AraC family transcriptional regulator [Pseudomonadota bacterium]